MSPKTEACLADIELACATGSPMAPSHFSHFHGRATASAAFRVALKRGLIELAATSIANTPIYRAAGYRAAIAEAATAAKH